MDADIGIIGGTGVAPLELFEHSEDVKMHTPYGPPSGAVTVGTLQGKRIAFLPRHGPDHSIPPGRINYRANIWALRNIGVTRILAPSAVGSLRDGISAGSFVLVDQFIDRTHGRASSFYEGGRVCHISVAEPVCGETASIVADAGRALGLQLHQKGTYVCIEGPRFSTRAESRLFRTWDCDVIGMTLVPECVLAREAGICYASIAMVTDYDTFREDAVSIGNVLAVMKENEEHVKRLLAAVVARIPRERGCACGNAPKDALL